MRRVPRPIFWLEAVMAGISGVLLVLTLLWKDWIEIAFGVEPDKGSGALEWFLVLACLTATVALGVLARAEWRRASPAP